MSVSEQVLVKTLGLETQGFVEDNLDLAFVYRTHARDVMRWATRLLGRPQDAQDVTQEVFCVVQRKLSGFRPAQGKLTTWLFRITEHVVRARRRKDRVYRWIFGERELPADAESTDMPADEALARHGDTALVYRALEALTEDDRTVLVMFELEGMPGEQVAELMGLKLATLWVRLHRARQRLSQRLWELEPEMQP